MLQNPRAIAARLLITQSLRSPNSSASYTRRWSSRRLRRKFCVSSARRPETCNRFSKQSWRMQPVSAMPNLAIFGSERATNFASSQYTADRLSTANISSLSPLLFPIRKTPSAASSATGKWFRSMT